MSHSSIFKMVLACSAIVLVSLSSYTVSAQTDLACRSDVPVMLEANGMAALSLEDVVDSTPPGANWEVSPNSVSCADIPTRLYTVTDLDTSNSCFGNLNVTDELAPTPICFNDVTVLLDTDGLATLFPQDFDAGSIDNCSQDLTFVLDRSEFTCDDLGLQDIQIDVIDEFGNQDFCRATINVVDGVGACEGADCVKNPKWIRLLVQTMLDGGL